MKILGVDPGIHGGLAIVEVIDGTAPRVPFREVADEEKRPYDRPDYQS